MCFWLEKNKAKMFQRQQLIHLSFSIFHSILWLAAAAAAILVAILFSDLHNKQNKADTPREKYCSDSNIEIHPVFDDVDVAKLQEVIEASTANVDDIVKCGDEQKVEQKPEALKQGPWL